MITTLHSCRVFLPYREVRKIIRKIDPCCVYTRDRTQTLYDIEHIVPRKICEDLFNGHYARYENDMHIFQR